MMVPFDGYHYPLEELRKSRDAADLIYRRGAPDTFDVSKLKQDLLNIRSGSDKVVKTPGFDHAFGDPLPDEHEFDRSKHRVVFCEGLYLLHDQEGWSDVKDIFDYSIFVKADVDACIDRLKIRNKCIPGYTEEEIEIRCEVVDRKNAMVVDRSKSRANMVVESVA
jgi:pantothenate kinase